MASLQSQAGTPSSASHALKISQACDDGQKFAEIFYQKVDKGRHTIGNLYHESATLVWNGTRVQGKANIVAFYEKLATSETQMLSLDSQPVLEVTGLGDQTMITVITSGRMKFGTRYRLFSESFTLVAESGVWKVVADTYRNY
jgi:NTF2-related export protein 1/2